MTIRNKHDIEMSDERPGNAGEAPASQYLGSSSEDELAGSSADLDARIQEATRRRDELKKQRQLKALDKEISQLEGAVDSGGSSSSEDEEAVDEEVPRRPEDIGSNVEPVATLEPSSRRSKRRRNVSETPEPRTTRLRPMKLNDYYGKSIREHREWTRDAQTAFRQAGSYFPTEGSKILYAMGFLKGDPKEQWYNYEAMHPAETLHWSDFSTFLLDNIEDPVNRSLDAQQRYEDAHQLQSQTVQQFNAYLEGVEAQLSFPYSEQQRVNQFFTKIRPELQIQITNVGTDLPKTKAALLSLAIRLEVNVRKTNPGYGKAKNNNNNQGGQGGKKRKRDKGNEPKDEDQNKNKNKNKQSNAKGKQNEGSKKQKKDHSYLTCYNCGKPGHIAPDCKEEKKDQPKVGGVTQMGDYEVSFKPKKEKPSSKTP